MIRFCFSILLLLCSIGMTIPSNAQQTPRTTTSGTGYLEYLPPDYSTNPTKKYPLLIFLHGTGEAGNGSAIDLEKVKTNGPPKLIQAGNTMCFTVNGVQECFIVISPQLDPNAGGWWPSVLQPIFDYVLNGPQNYRIDKTRVYLTGLSLGGQGVYIGLGETTDIFAAGAVIAGFNNGNGCIISARKIPVWGFHGELDGTIPYATGLNEFDKISSCTMPVPTAELKWTSYPSVGHNAWDNAYTTDHSIQSPLNVYEWLLTKNKNLTGNALPTANAGTDQVITLPTNSLTLTGIGTDSDGTISSYNWTKVSSLPATLANTNTSTLNITGLASGSHVVRLTVTDNQGATASDDVNVVVNPATNLALGKSAVTSSNENTSIPGAKAVDGNTTTRWSSLFSDPQWMYIDLGSNVNINRVKITWETAAASNYKIQTSSDAATWTDIKTISGNTTLSNDHTGLTGSGRYVRMYGTTRKTVYGYSIYEFEVYGNVGNALPVASAGADQTITLPINSLNLTGTGTDSDGTISSYAWAKVSGLAATLNNATTSTLALTGLVSGACVFRLTVTDNSGATATDDVSVIVNIAPTANAGVDQTITLPTNSLALLGSGIDSDGTVSSYGWTKASGPAATLANANTSTLSLSSLVAGTYVFRLTVTDNLGATAFDDANVIVNSVPSNLALGKPTFTSSNEGWATTGAQAVDGIGTTRWSSQFSDPQWIYVDLGPIININRVKITWEAASASNYKIQTSGDAVTWTDIKTIAGNTTLTNDHTGLSGSGRYVRMFGITRRTIYGYSIYEFEVYGNAPATAARIATTATENPNPTSLAAAAVEETAGLLFLDKTYLGSDYSIAIFNSNGNAIFKGKWNTDFYHDIFSEAGLYFYHVLKTGKRVDSGKVMIVRK